MEEIAIDCWIARDKSGGLWLYEKRPVAKSEQWIAAVITKLPEEHFPGITWEGGTYEAKITIEIKA